MEQSPLNVQQSLKYFRFAIWGILSAMLIYVGYMVYNITQISMFVDWSFIVKRLAIIVSILMVEVAVYWMIRKRLYYKSWVYIHVGCIWFSMVALPALYLLFIYMNFGNVTSVSRNISMFYGLGFLASTLLGHLFFILTIVKSFSAKKKLQTPDASDSPHILDEFNQQSSRT